MLNGKSGSKAEQDLMGFAGRHRGSLAGTRLRLQGAKGYQAVQPHKTVGFCKYPKLVWTRFSMESPGGSPAGQPPVLRPRATGPLAAEVWNYSLNKVKAI